MSQAADDKEWIPPIHLEMHGVKYEINVEKSPAGYSATWACSDCFTDSEANLTGSTAKGAQQRARANLVAHHTLYHQPGG